MGLLEAQLSVLVSVHALTTTFPVPVLLAPSSFLQGKADSSSPGRAGLPPSSLKLREDTW